MFKLRKKIFLAVVLFLIIIPVAVGAAGIIPCGTSDNPKPCTLCHFVVGFKSLIDYGFNIVVILAIVALFFAGVTYIVSFGDETMMTKAKGFIKSTLIGFAVIFGGWLIVSLTMTVLSAKTATDEGGVLGIKIESWNKFTCDKTSTEGQGGSNNKNNENTKNVCGKNGDGECYDGSSCPKSAPTLVFVTPETECSNGQYCCKAGQNSCGTQGICLNVGSCPGGNELQVNPPCPSGQKCCYLPVN